MAKKSTISSLLFSILGSFILVGALYSFSKTRFRVYPIAKENIVNMYADNGENYPITLDLSYQLDNMQAVDDTEFFIIPPKTTRALLTTFKTTDTLKETKYDYSFKRYFGDLTKTGYDKDAVYSLPLPPKGSYLLGQGYNGSTTHKGNSAYALDFQLSEGTPVYAARDGVVAQVVDEYDQGCPKEECAKYENYILVYHKDGVFSGYAHLKQHSAQVKIGDSVRAGQFIAESGATGMATGPHLHYEVLRWRMTKKGVITVSLPVKFRINKRGKIGVPKEGYYYKRRY